jgi:hypothetical protein
MKRSLTKGGELVHATSSLADAPIAADASVRPGAGNNARQSRVVVAETVRCGFNANPTALCEGDCLCLFAVYCSVT